MYREKAKKKKKKEKEKQNIVLHAQTFHTQYIVIPALANSSPLPHLLFCYI